MAIRYTGCLTCKQRHLKCDGTQPICGRCSKSNRSCYEAKTSDGNLTFILSENVYASGKRKRPRGPRALPPPSRPLAMHLATTAIHQYLNTDLQPPRHLPSLLQSVEDDILPIYKAHQHEPTIHLAISALALAIFGRKHSQPRVLIEACIAYQQLLHQTRSVLSSSPNSKFEIEKLLFITFCMSRYEDAVHVPMRPSQKPKQFTSASHHDGSLALIRASTSTGEYLDSRVPSIVKTTRRCMIKSALLRGRHVPEWIRRGEDFGEEGLDLEYDRLSVELARLRQQLRSHSPETSPRGTDLAVDTLKLDEKLMAWSSHISPRQNPSSFDVDIDSEDQLISPSVTPTLIRLRFHAFRILTLSTCISFWNRTDSPDENLAKILDVRLVFFKTITLFKATLGHLLGFAPSSDSPSLYPFTDIKIDPTLTRLIVWPLNMTLLAEEVQGLDRETLENVMRQAARTSGFGVLEDL